MDKNLDRWLDYLAAISDEELKNAVTFIGFDNSIWTTIRKDITLQLNYQSLHHRAQIQSILRKKRIEPDFGDYVRTGYRKVNH